MPSYVVTGASRGIGLEFVRQLSFNADNTIFGLVRNQSGATALNELASHALNVHVIQADITSVPALKAAAQQVAKVTGGTLDYLINNAALLDQGRTTYTLSSYTGQEELLEKDIHEAIQVNVIGVIHTTNVFLPLLRKGSVKKVITISSGAGDPDFVIAAQYPIAVPYSISKAALNLAVAKYAAEFRDEGFVFLSVSPGFVNTAQGPPTPESVEFVTQLVKHFKKAAPEWDGKPLTPESSVKQVLNVIENATVRDTGAFISQHGNRQWL